MKKLILSLSALSVLGISSNVMAVTKFIVPGDPDEPLPMISISPDNKVILKSGVITVRSGTRYIIYNNTRYVCGDFTGITLSPASFTLNGFSCYAFDPTVFEVKVR